MASTIKVDKLFSESPSGATENILLNDDGTTNLKGNTTVTGTCTATTFSGSGASLTNLPAANLTGTLPAISGASLTGITTTGRVINRWEDTSTSETNITATETWTDTDLSITLTPASAASRFDVEWWSRVYSSVDSYGNNAFRLRLMRDSSALGGSGGGWNYNASAGADGSFHAIHVGSRRIDHPNTTSSITYKVQFKIINTGDPENCTFNWSVWGYDGVGAALIIQEYDQ